jgi:NAD+ kinase
VAKASQKKETNQAVLLCSKRGNAAATAANRQLTEWLVHHGYRVIDATETDGMIPEAQLKDVCLGVIIGGDGTFLTLVRRLEKKEQFPIMGVNLGSLGFITDIPREEMIPSVEDALAGKYPIDLRRLMQVEICREDVCRISGLVFNDAVITKDVRTTMLKFDVNVGNEFLSYVRADGYIIATPTGSTAYGLSAGGPLLHPGVNGLVLVPICSHSLSSRSVVIPQEMPIEIIPRDFRGPAYLVLDGQINHEILQADTIKIRMSKHSLRLVRSPRQNWSQTLRIKMDMA